MRLISYSSQLKLAGAHAVAIGNFDGVHRGHQQLIAKLVSDSKKLGLKSLLCTFSPLPWQVLSAADAPKENLSNLRSKLELLSQYGLDAMLLVRFNEKFRRKTPADFIQKFLVQQLNTSHLITGEDFHFAFERKGTPQQLSQAQEHGLFSYSPVNSFPTEVDKISSSDIRQLLAAGDLHKANNMLGYRYFISGRVTQGQGMGAKLGFATANINLQDFVPPTKGVYLCLAYIGGAARPAVANLGYRPTISSSGNKKNKFVAEAHILNFSENIYGKLLKLEFIEYLRPEKKFASVGELTTQIKQDIASGVKIIGDNPSIIRPDKNAK